MIAESTWGHKGSIVFWSIVLTVYVLLWAVIFTVLRSVLAAAKICVVPLPLVGAFVILVFMYFDQKLLSLVSWKSEANTLEKLALFFFYFIIEQVLQVIFLTLVHPKAIELTDVKIATDAPLEPDAIPNIPKREDIVIGGRRFALTAIQYISAVEHYVRGGGLDGDHFIRAKLSDTIEQTSPEDGILVHRSHWVCTNGVAWAKRSAQKLYVVANDGTEFSVARNRRKQVLNWLKDQNKDVFALR